MTSRDAARALSRTVAAIAADDPLPSAADVTAMIPPTSKALVRRAGRFNVWVWFVVRGDEVVFLAVTSVPPVPVDE